MTLARARAGDVVTDDEDKGTSSYLDSLIMIILILITHLSMSVMAHGIRVNVYHPSP